MYFFLIVVGFFHGFVLLPLFLTHVNIVENKSIGLENIHREKLIDSTYSSKRDTIKLQNE